MVLNCDCVRTWWSGQWIITIVIILSTFISIIFGEWEDEGVTTYPWHDASLLYRWLSELFILARLQFNVILWVRLVGSMRSIKRDRDSKLFTVLFLDDERRNIMLAINPVIKRHLLKIELLLSKSRIKVLLLLLRWLLVSPNHYYLISFCLGRFWNLLRDGPAWYMLRCRKRACLYLYLVTVWRGCLLYWTYLNL